LILIEIKMKSGSIYIALGANLPSGGRSLVETLNLACDLLNDAGIAVVARSSYWRGPAWPNPDDPAYVNAMIEVETQLAPKSVLNEMHRIEAELGRTRLVRWESRTLDLDLIDYRGLCLPNDKGLQLPHPRAVDRAFVLLPLCEIAPAWKDPVSGAGINALIGALDVEDIQAMCKLQIELEDAREGLALGSGDS
jgi:2-amino-4-hydroxy-6-hydroxymethyldihydropteridine diphosphokinase